MPNIELVENGPGFIRSLSQTEVEEAIKARCREIEVLKALSKQIEEAKTRLTIYPVIGFTGVGKSGLVEAMVNQGARGYHIAQPMKDACAVLWGLEEPALLDDKSYRKTFGPCSGRPGGKTFGALMASAFQHWRAWDPEVMRYGLVNFLNKTIEGTPAIVIDGVRTVQGMSWLEAWAEDNNSQVRPLVVHRDGVAEECHKEIAPRVEKLIESLVSPTLVCNHFSAKEHWFSYCHHKAKSLLETHGR